jgi:hypothetical protein
MKPEVYKSKAAMKKHEKAEPKKKEAAEKKAKMPEFIMKKKAKK